MMWSRTKMKIYLQNYREEHRKDIKLARDKWEKKSGKHIFDALTRRLKSNCYYCNSKCDGSNFVLNNVICSTCFDDYVKHTFVPIPHLRINDKFSSFKQAHESFVESKRKEN